MGGWIGKLSYAENKHPPLFGRQADFWLLAFLATKLIARPMTDIRYTALTHSIATHQKLKVFPGM